MAKFSRGLDFDGKLRTLYDFCYVNNEITCKFNFCLNHAPCFMIKV